MQFNITHTAEYHYDKEIYLDPHTLRIRPRSDHNQQVLAFSLTVNPKPAGQFALQGPENNILTNVWFDQPTDYLTIVSRCTIHTSLVNPFNYLPDDKAHLPLKTHYFKPALRPFLARSDIGSDDTVGTWSSRFCEAANGNIIEFLTRLNLDIYSNFKIFHREFGMPWPADQTLNRHEGACRDVTMLFVDACRSQGLPARFVSGYTKEVDSDGKRHLHSWPEVYVPGGGWRGYDPTIGLAVTDGHAAICSAAEPVDASPLSGYYRGNGVKCRLDTHIELIVSES